MLEEEKERKKAEKAGFKRVTWPPPRKEKGYFYYIEQDPLQTKDQLLLPNFYQPHNAASQFEPPPSVITLRSEIPILQQPSPVYQAQPAATNPNSGTMYGDLKWPPVSLKQKSQPLNQELVRSLICRPQRINKNYNNFFTQHASTKTYLGYQAPPGTQYFNFVYHQ